MRSLVGGLVSNRSPVPHTGRYSSFSGLGGRKDPRSRLTQLEMAETVGTLYAIVDLLATAVAKVKFYPMREAASGLEEERTLITDHPALSIWKHPNDFFTTTRLKHAVQQQVDLCGIGFVLVARDSTFGVPVELWPVRSDRMRPVPDPDEFLAGYVYTAPDGVMVPLGVQDVLPIIVPDPVDVYGGLSAVPSLMVDLGVISESAAWSRNFFKNGAAPGGIVQSKDELNDKEFKQFMERWRENHQGVNNAHRVALLENGMQWVDRKYSMRDMQFTELRTVSDRKVQEAFRVHDHMLGKSESVNRANADAAGDDFSKWLTTPRADRWVEVLDALTRLFGKASAKSVAWCYDELVSQDEETQAKILVSRASAAATLKAAGWDADEVLVTCELPPMGFTEPPKPLPPQPPAAGGNDAGTADDDERETDEENAAPFAPWMTAHTRPPFPLVIGEPAWASASPFRAASGDADEVDVTPIAESHMAALDALIERWSAITDAQREELVRQVREIVAAGEYERLTTMTVSSQAGADMLLAAMNELAREAGQQVATEAQAQGVAVTPVMPLASDLATVAAVTAALLAAGLALSAATEAARVISPEISPREVGEAVADHLRGLTDAQPRKQVGGALHGAQNAGRIATFKAGPIAALYANEKNDKNTCGPCKAINGRWLGNSNNGTDMEQIEKTYPTAGYIDCLGGVNCRGTVTGVWRSKTAGGQ